MSLSAHQKTFFRPLALVMTIATTAAASHVLAQVRTNALAQTPLFISESYPPLNMLVMGRDHKLYYEAYNDAADLDGDGALDIGYKPKIDYFGYFHNRVCYTHKDGMFVPSSAAGGSNGKECSGAWSGDFLNYLATSRMDAIRKVLYGGYRVVDTTSRTVLQAAYIPQDSHSWGKMYDPERDAYDISKYVPLAKPPKGKRHLFAVTTMQQDGVPELRVMPNTQFFVWSWISKEAPVARVTCSHPTELAANGWPKTVSCDPVTSYALKIEVCNSKNAALRDAESCKAYPNGGGQPVYKPVGLLHDFGENEKMFFGLLTGSYQNNTSGGVIRKNISAFADEVDAQTGIFKSNVEGLVRNINTLKMTDFIYNKNTPDYSGGQYVACGWKVDGPITTAGFDSSKCSMWGNPIGEMMFEGLRYFAGADQAHPKFAYKHESSKDKDVGFSAPPAWISPYKSKAAGGGGFKYCAKPVMTILSDINPSYDYRMPGSRYESLSAEAGRLKDFNVSTETDAIGENEGLKGKSFFIGQTTTTNADSTPSVKVISDGLSYVRGLSPEEPSKQGTYYSAGVARFGANNAIAGDPNISNGLNKVMTYSVAIASPLPEIKFPVGDDGRRFVTISPFAKSVTWGGLHMYKTNFQPTNQIVEYFVTKIANTGAGNKDKNVNGGRPYAEFRINFEDVEQGADHDMDAIAHYIISEEPDKRIRVRMNSEYASGSIMQYMGYVISGTTKDGTYIEVRDSDSSEAQSRDHVYKLNTPPGKDSGYCAHTPLPYDCKVALPRSSERYFTPSSTTVAASFLKDPLWYAAKYGMPDRDPASITGDPDNYFLVTNAGTLKEQMTKAFNAILQTTSSVTAAAVEPNLPSVPGVAAEASVYRTEFESADWSGDLIKEKNSRSATGVSSRERVWSAADKLARRNTSRKIYFAGKDVAGQPALANFDWGTLSRDEDWKAALNRNSGGVVDNRGKDRVSFLHGATPAGMRERKKLDSGKINILGDIVNSSALRIGANGKGVGQYRAEAANALEGGTLYGSFENAQAGVPEMIYVGANDGMLHAFDAASGEEVFAYVPSGVRNNLSVLTDPGYGKSGIEHRYFVDGTPVAADVYFQSASGAAASGWRKVLLGMLGAGGRQIFALDITNPTAPKLLWEFGSGNDGDMGFMAEPVIARLNDNGATGKGKWVALVAGGYQGAQSVAGKTSMFVLDIQTGEIIREFELDGKEVTSDPLGNGLSRLSAVDNDGDGKVDMVYAGDLLGNVWRIDMRKGASSAWSANLFYVAKDASGKRQPITAAPYVVSHPLGRGNIVVVATGRYLTLGDKGTTQPQTIYGIWDRYSGKDHAVATPTASKGRGNLQQQTFADANLGSAMGAKVLTDNEVKWLKDGAQVSDTDDKVATWGWYVDLTYTGERVVYDMTLYGRGLWFNSIYNDQADPCKPGLSGMLYAIDAANGGKLDYQAIDITGDALIDSRDTPQDKISSGWKWNGGKLTFGRGDVFSPDGLDTKIASGVQKGRQSWRRQPENP